MKKIMLVFGTRPEAIKMCPLVNELKARKDVQTVVCVTGQHRDMLTPVLDAFSIVPDYNLDIMRDNQTLFDITTTVLDRIKPVLEAVRPDVVLVHGDTTTAFAAALACFYLRIPVGHVEAGLRTHDLAAPFPEEFNRRAVRLISRYHFAPTGQARENLLAEGAPEDTVFLTGNTVIDALKTTVCPEYTHPLLDWAAGNRLILLTAHRRENRGAPMEQIFHAVRRAADAYRDIRFLYPIHPAPAIQSAAEAILGGHSRIRLCEPLDVIDFHNLMARSYLILTDSGGIQEEATALGKPVLVMRNTTERPEGLTAGNLALVGTEEDRVFTALQRLLEDPAEYRRMSAPSHLYGDGFASRRIADFLTE